MPEISVNHADQIRKLKVSTRPSANNSLGGTVDMERFVNIEEIEITNHGISSIENYYPEQLQIFSVQNNNIKQELPTFGKDLRILQIYNDDVAKPLGTDPSNSFSGNLRKIISKCYKSLSVVDASSSMLSKNNLSGLLPEFKQYTNLYTFDISDNEKIEGGISSLADCRYLKTFKAHNTSISGVAEDFSVPNTIRVFSLYNVPIQEDSLNRVVKALYDTLTSTYDSTTDKIDIGPANSLTDTSLGYLNTLRTRGFDVNVRSSNTHNLLDNSFARNASLGLSIHRLKATSSVAMRIRRSWDNVEIDVGFDSSGKVSNNSPVSNASNNKTYVNANDFLTEIIYQPFALPVVATNSSYNHVLLENTTTNANGSYNFKGTGQAGAGTNGGGRLVFVGDSLISEKDSFRSRLRISGNVVTTTAGGTPNRILKPGNSANSNGGGVFNFMNANEQGVNIQFTSTGQFSEERFGQNDVQTSSSNYLTTTLGSLQLMFNSDDILQIENFKAEVIKHSATVKTWYDQSGNGDDFTNTTIADQPMIAHDGTMLDGVFFAAQTENVTGTSAVVEGTDELIGTSTIIAGDNTSDFSAFITAQGNDDGYLFANGQNATTGVGLYMKNGGNRAAILSGNDISADHSVGITNTVSFSSDYKLLDFLYDGDGDDSINVTPSGTTTPTVTQAAVAMNFNAATENAKVGNRPSGPSEGTHFHGKIKEIVIYDGELKSVQRSAIQKEIQDRLSLT